MPKLFINRRTASEHRTDPSQDPDAKQSIFNQVRTVYNAHLACAQTCMNNEKSVFPLVWCFHSNYHYIIWCLSVADPANNKYLHCVFFPFQCAAPYQMPCFCQYPLRSLPIALPSSFLSPCPGLPKVRVFPSLPLCFSPSQLKNTVAWEVGLTGYRQHSISKCYVLNKLNSVQ